MQPPSMGKPDSALVPVGVASLSRPATTQVFNHLMQQLPALVSAMHAHLHPWVPQMLELVRMHWHGPLLLQVIALLEQLTLLLRQALTPYTAELIPLLAAVIEADKTAQRVLSLRALNALDGFGPLLWEYTAVLLPAMLRLLSQADPGSRAQEDAITALQRISIHLPIARAATSFVPVLLRIMKDPRSLELRGHVVALLTTFMAKAGRAWRVHERRTAVTFEEANLPHGLALDGPYSLRENGVDGTEEGGQQRQGERKVTGPQRPAAAWTSAASTLAAIGEDSLITANLAQYREPLPHALAGNQAELLAFLHAEGSRHRRSAPAPRSQPARLPVKQTTMRRLCRSAVWLRRLVAGSSRSRFFLAARNVRNLLCQRH